MSREIPESLRKAGITSVTDNIPPGFEINLGNDFVRIFREEIEEKLFGWKRPAPPVLRRFPRRAP